MNYAGPTVATISIDEDCVYKTHMKTKKTKIGFARTQKCSNSTLAQHAGTFRMDRRKPSKPGDEEEYIQIKILDNHKLVCL